LANYKTYEWMWKWYVQTSFFSLMLNFNNGIKNSIFEYTLYTQWFYVSYVRTCKEKHLYLHIYICTRIKSFTTDRIWFQKYFNFTEHLKVHFSIWFHLLINDEIHDGRKSFPGEWTFLTHDFWDEIWNKSLFLRFLFFRVFFSFRLAMVL
jgi:hypothetical protein